MRQGAERFEKRVSEGLGIEFGKATGDEAVEVMKQHIEALSAKGAALDPKDEQAVKNSPVFQRAMREAAENHNKIVKDYEAKLTGAQTEFQRKETLRTVREDAMAMLTELNVNLPKDPKVKANQLKLLDLYLNDHTFEKEGDEWIVKDKEGKEDPRVTMRKRRGIDKQPAVGDGSLNARKNRHTVNPDGLAGRA